MTKASVPVANMPAASTMGAGCRAGVDVPVSKSTGDVSMTTT